MLCIDAQLARLASSVPLYAATALVITLTFVRDYTGILNLLRKCTATTLQLLPQVPLCQQHSLSQSLHTDG